MKNMKYFLSGLGLLVVGFGVGFFVQGEGSSGGQADVILADEQAANEPTVIDFETLEVVDASTDDDAVLGSVNAPITIIEFSDFQCPYCARFVNETMVLIKENYIDTGIVKLVFRDYPLSSHSAAAPAAVAAECVGNFGDEAFFKMHDALFADSSWTQSDDPKTAVIEVAKGIGYDVASCVMNGDTLQEVGDDFAAARTYGVTGTPSFFVNGKMLVGAWPYEVFDALIQYQLSQLEQ